MIHSGRAARHGRLKKRHHRDEELNLISLIDIFSVLVFFLIVNFGDMSILDMNLPAPSNEPVQEQEKPLKLEVVVRGDRIEVANDGDTLNTFPNTVEGYDYPRLSEYLVRVKTQYAETRDVRVLLEPQVAYDSVVQIMDTVRVVEQTSPDGRHLKSTLFPEIALGDAPMPQP